MLIPFILGTVVGAIVGERIPVGNAAGEPISSWLNPLSLLIGALFVATGVYLSVVLLVSDARQTGDEDLVRYFSRRAIGAAVTAGAVALAGIFALRADARYIYDGLISDAIPLVALSAVCGLSAILLLWRGARRDVRVLAVGAVVAVIWGWAVVQHAYLLPETLTIDAGAGTSTTLNMVLGVFGVAVLVVVASLGLLYTLSQRTLLEEAPAPQPAGKSRG